MKDYGLMEPPETFLDRHGARIGAAIMTASAIMVIGAMIMAFIVMAPTAIDQMQVNSAEVVAMSKGAAE